MSNDLISRSAAGKLLRAYADEVGCNRGEYELANGILKAVTFLSDSENVPTAYDVDKVMEQLNERYVDAIGMLRDRRGTAYEYPAEIRCGVYKISIEIVKAGGVNE